MSHAGVALASVLLHDDRPLHAAFADPTLAQSATTALAGRREDALPVG